MSKQLPVIVVRGNDICFLGIIRSLGRAGIPFRTVSFTWEGAKPWWSENSRFFSDDYTIPNPYTNPAQALTSLRDIGKELLEEFGVPLLTIPSSDTNLMLFLDNEQWLKNFFVLQGDQNFASYRNDVAHKFECFELLAEGDTTICPQTLRCSNESDIEYVVENMSYPCVFKPAVKDYGQTFYAHNNGLKAVECLAPHDLRRGLQESMAKGFDLVVQEKVIFDRVEDEIPFYGYVDAKGQLRMGATGVKEVIQPYPFGTANVLRLSWHPELIECAREVVARLKWRGLVMIEFIHDQKDQHWKVIEINVRPWLFIGFYDRFGLHYVRMLYEDWMGQLADSSELIAPSKNATDQAPIHVDLNSLEAGFSEPERKAVFGSTDSLVSWLLTFGNIITSTYMDHSDPAPDEANLLQLSKRTSLKQSELKSILDQTLTDTGQGDQFTERWQ